MAQFLANVQYTVNSPTVCFLCAMFNQSRVAQTLCWVGGWLRPGAHIRRAESLQGCPISAEKCSTVRVCQQGSVHRRRRVINHHFSSGLFPTLSPVWQEEKEGEAGMTAARPFQQWQQWRLWKWLHWRLTLGIRKGQLHLLLVPFYCLRYLGCGLKNNSWFSVKDVSLNWKSQVLWAMWQF